MEKLPVIFRKERGKNGEVTAVFPAMPQDAGGHFMTCYAHIGQHSGCSFGWYWNTRAATPEDYGDLLAELRTIYEHGEDPVELVIYRRITPQHRREFVRESRRFRAA